MATVTPRDGVSPLVYVADNTAQLTLGQPYTPGSGSFMLAAPPGWTPTPAAPLSITLIQAISYGRGQQEVKTEYAVVAVAGATCTIGGILDGVDQPFAAGDYAESRVAASAVNAAALLLAYDGSTAGFVLTSNGPLAPPSWQVSPGVGSSGTVAPGTAGQLGGYASDGITLSGVTVGANLSITGGTLNAAAGVTGTVNVGFPDQLGYYAAYGQTISGLTLGANLSIAGGVLSAAAGGSGTVVSGAANQLGFYAQAGNSISGLNLGSNLSISGNTLNAAGGGGGSGTVNAGTLNQLGFYAAAGTSLSGLTVGSNLSIAGGHLNAAGSGTVGAGTANQLGYYPAAGTSISGLTLGTNLSITGGVLNAAGGSTGAGTVNSGTTNQLGFYAATGTSISGLSLGTNLTISGNALNAAGGGSGTVNAGSANQLGYYSAAGTAISGLQLGTNLSISAGTLNAAGGGGTGTVTTVSVAAANGFSGTVATPGTTPAITLQTTVNGVLKGLSNGLAPAVAGTDYQPPITLTTTGTSGAATFVGNVLNVPNYATAGGGGTVTTVSVAAANGFSGTVANAGTTPAITLQTSITGMLKGASNALAAAVAGTDYQAPIALTTTGTSGAATFAGNVLNIPNYATGGGGGSGTVNAGTANQLGYYSGPGTTISGLTLGTNLSISGGILSAATPGALGGLMVNGPTYTNTAAGGDLTSQATLIAGVRTIPGGTLAIGHQIWFHANGVYTGNGTTSLGLRFSFDQATTPQVVLGNVAGSPLAPNAAGAPWSIEGRLFVRAAGVAGSIGGSAVLRYGSGTGVDVTYFIKEPGTPPVAVTIDTTVPRTPSLSPIMSAATPTVSMAVTNFLWTLVPPPSAASPPAGGYFQNGAAVANTVTPGDITTGATLAAGVATIPAGTLHVGDLIWFHAAGVVSSVAGATLAFRFALDMGGTPIIVLAPAATPSLVALTNMPWAIRGVAVVRAYGVQGAIGGAADFRTGFGGGADSAWSLKEPGTPPVAVTVDTTVPHTPTLSPIWGAAQAGNSVAMSNFVWGVTPATSTGLSPVIP